MIYVATWLCWAVTGVIYYLNRRDLWLVVWFGFALLYTALVLFPTVFLDAFRYVVLHP